VLDHGVGQDVDHVGTVDSASHMDCQAFACVFVDQVEHAHRPSVVGERADEVVRSDVIPVLRSQPYTRAVVQPQADTRLLLLWNLQPLAAPDSFHAILAYIPAGFAQLNRDAPVAVSAILAGQRNDGPGQRVFVVPLCGLIALRAAWLINQLARMALTRSALLCMLHSGTPTLRA
jgi:hypothetical protein